MSKKPKDSMQIEWVPVESITPYEHNAKSHSARQINDLVRQIRTVGWTQPIVVDGDRVIIAGHGRRLAAIKMKLKKIPVLVKDDLTPEQVRAARIADNKLNESEWIEEMLRVEFLELKHLNVDLEETGFYSEEIQKIIASGNVFAGGEEEKIPPPPKTPRSRPGDIWLLEESRLICGDSTDSATIARLMGEEKADMLVTDPPYGIGYEYDNHDDTDPEANKLLVKKVFSLHSQAGKIWTPGLMNLARDIDRFGKTRVIAWHKKFAMAGNGMGGASTWEPVLVCTPTAKNLSNDVIVVQTDREIVDGKNLRELHSCPKPVALFSGLIESLTRPSDLIVEPFCGSGTTLIACEKTRRRCYACEIDPGYVDVILDRWSGYTKKDPIRESDGALWSAVKAGVETKIRKRAFSDRPGNTHDPLDSDLPPPA